MKNEIIPSGVTSVGYASDEHYDPVSQWMADAAGVTLVPMFGDLDRVAEAVRALLPPVKQKDA